MTTVYALSILLAFSLPGSVWLGWLLYEARGDRTRLAAHEIALCIVKGERDDALANLKFVLNHEHVASTVDMIAPTLHVKGSVPRISLDVYRKARAIR